MNSRFLFNVLDALMLPPRASYAKVRSLTDGLMNAIFAAQNDGAPMPVHGENDVKVAVFVNGWGRLYMKAIPFELWADIAQEGLALTKEMIVRNDFNFGMDPKCKTFLAKYHERKEKIRLMPEYGHLFELGP